VAPQLRVAVDRALHWISRLVRSLWPCGFINTLVMRVATEQGYFIFRTYNEQMNVVPEELSIPENVNRVKKSGGTKLRTE
jgi:hypothetical protein